MATLPKAADVLQRERGAAGEVQALLRRIERVLGWLEQAGRAPAFRTVIARGGAILDRLVERAVPIRICKASGLAGRGFALPKGHPKQQCHPRLGAAGIVTIACCLAAAPTALAGVGSGVGRASGPETTATGPSAPPSGGTSAPQAPSGPSGDTSAPQAPSGGGGGAARMRSWNRRLRQEASALADCLSALDAFDRRVIVLRAGIDSGHPLSRGAAAGRLGVSRGAVGRAEHRGLRGLKRANRSTACAQGGGTSSTQGGGTSSTQTKRGVRGASGTPGHTAAAAAPRKAAGSTKAGAKAGPPSQVPRSTKHRAKDRVEGAGAKAPSPRHEPKTAAVQPTAGGGSDKGDGPGTALLVLLVLLGLGTVAVLVHRARPAFLGAAVKGVGRHPARDSDGLPRPPHRDPPPTNGLLASADAKPPAAAGSSAVQLQPWELPVTQLAKAEPTAPPPVADSVPAGPATWTQPIRNGSRTDNAPTRARTTDPSPAGEPRDRRLDGAAPAKPAECLARTASAPAKSKAPWEIPIRPADRPASEPPRPASQQGPGEPT
jgi:hypothetical protein